MAENLPNQKGTGASRGGMPNGGNAAPNSAEHWFEYLKTDFWAAHGTKIIAAAVVLAVAVFALVQHFSSTAEKTGKMTEELGRGLDYVYTGKSDSALIAFETSINSGALKGLPLAKAALLAGNIYLQNGNLDSAEILYKLSVENSGKVDLILSAAEHGLAVVAMERKDYARAISLLNAFVDKYGKRDGDLAKRYAKKEPSDLAPTVPDVLWKLSLCYLETGDSASTKKTLEKLLKIYGDSPRASNAQKLLATL